MLLVNSWPPRQHERVHQPPVVLRSRTDTGLEQSLFVRSDVTRRAQSYWSGNCPSSDWCVKSLRTSRPISDSKAQRCWLCRKPARLTWSDSLRTRTCAQFTPRESQLCPKTSNLLAAFVGNEHKRTGQQSVKRSFLGPHIHFAQNYLTHCRRPTTTHVPFLPLCDRNCLAAMRKV